mmetsp:Transcript_101150/g.291210  ORF Transcript_101150/g.291210 Transcript_101150/m.291210 type:complete len:191 (-) Transcript_101150:127-699(-)
MGTSEEAVQGERRAQAVAREGDAVEVTRGPHVGKRGRVIKVAGQGSETRWRVELDDGKATWCEDVQALEPGASETADAQANGELCGFGCRVEIRSHPHAGRHGLVLQVQGEGDERRWKVLVDGGHPPVWVSEVKPEGAVAERAPMGRAPETSPPKAQPCFRPAPDLESYFQDESGSEASDLEMPALIPKP